MASNYTIRLLDMPGCCVEVPLDDHTGKIQSHSGRLVLSGDFELIDKRKKKPETKEQSNS